MLYNRHRLTVDFSGFLLNFVGTIVFISNQMTYIRDILDVGYRVATEPQVAYNYIETDVGFRMTQVRITINCGTTDIETDVTWQHRFKFFFLSAQTVGEAKGHGRVAKVCYGQKSDNLPLRTESYQVLSQAGMANNDQRSDLVGSIHLGWRSKLCPDAIVYHQALNFWKVWP